MRTLSLVGWLTALSLALLVTFFPTTDAIFLPPESVVPQKRSSYSGILQKFRFISNSLEFKPVTFNPFQSNPFQAVAQAHTVGIPADFWDRAASLGSAIQTYAENLLHNAASNPVITQKISHFKGTMDQVVDSTKALQSDVRDAAEAHGASLDQISEELSGLFATILEDLKLEFPPPDQAPNHEERCRMVSHVMGKAEDYLVHVGGKYGMSEVSLRGHFGKIRPHVERLIVITGDLVEEHPVLLENLLVSGAIFLIPESWFLRPFLSLFGFGPYGPVKGSAGAWAQRRFWGAAVAKGSWFAHLQRAGMKLRFPVGTGAKIITAIGAALGITGTLRGCSR